MKLVDQQKITYQIDQEKLTAKILPSINAENNIRISRSFVYETQEYIITEMQEGAFRNSFIRSLTFDDDSAIDSIPKNAFAYSSIESINFPINLRELKEGWCHQTQKLTNITISSENEYFKVSKEGLLLQKSRNDSKNYDILNFSKRDIHDVTIPSAIKTINSYSFEFCEKLRTVNFLKDSKLIKICKKAFSHSTIESIIIPKSVKEIDIKSFYFCNKLISFKYEENSELKTIGCDAFMNSFESTSNLTSIPTQYESMLNAIDNNVMKSIYSKFSFKYCKCINDQSLFFSLKKHKFIVYHFPNQSDFCKQNTNQILNSVNKTNCIFCVEYECIIIEQIDILLINSIINNLENQKIKLINVSDHSINSIKPHEKAKEEIDNFCSHFKKIINQNDFIKYTINSLIGYLIRRYYYPSSYFKDSSFFNFDKTINKREHEKKVKLKKYLFNENSNSNTLENIIEEIQSLKNLTDYDNKYFDNEFSNNDFIKLRTIYNNINSVYSLVIHLKSFYLFLMKKIPKLNNYLNGNEIKHEINFCKYSHRFFPQFYGFIKEDANNICFIYEFMSGGSIDDYIDNNTIDKKFLLENIIRVFNGIDFLHSNNLVHRDVKPSNILIDHDGLAYISDFETIRSLDPSDGPFTADVGTPFFLAPEQNLPKNTSYSTDIYSFGLTLYCIYEKIYNFPKNLSNEERFNVMNKISENIGGIYEKCVKDKPEERIKNDDILMILNNECNSFYYLEQYLICNQNNFTNKINITNFIFEKIFIQQTKESLLLCKIQIDNFQKLLVIEDKSILRLHLGSLYENCLGVEQDFSKAIKYYELSAKLNNSEALFKLGNFYEDGLGDEEEDYSVAMEYYELSAKLNNSEALFKLGNFYEYGRGVEEEDYSKAMEYYKLSAELNNSKALFNLGYFYEVGLGVECDYTKAIKYYKLSAELNNSKALFKLGFFYEVGLGVECDYTKAIKYYESSSKHNNSIALLSLAKIYADGKGVEQDYSKAIEYYLLSANLKNSEAFLNLAIIYEEGKGTKKDLTKAIKYYELAADLHNPSALFYLGFIYEEGRLIKQDYSKAIKYYKLAVEYHNSDASFKLGCIYLDGLGVEQNYSEAIHYFKLSAQEYNSFALFKLAFLYEDGLGVERDYLKAKKYYELSARQNNPYALFNLGKLYENGNGVAKDYLKAKKYYKLSARSDYSHALFSIGNLYLNGLGVQQNYSKAKKYFEKAAQLNHSDGFLYLGNLYRDGLGVEQNYSEAKKYYELSTKLNNSNALFNLGKLYEEGKGVKKDFSEALKYYKLSAELSNSRALFHLGDIYSNSNMVNSSMPEAIKYFTKSIEIERGVKITKSIVDKVKYMFFDSNNYRYISYNDLGLIFITDLKENIQNAEECLKESAFAEYPFGQNNFGLFNELYLNNLDNAEYMYERSSKHNFSIADFNLARLKEKQEKMNESIECYICASKHEDEPLMYRNIMRNDKRLEISKTFIICLTNLILTEYYFKLHDYAESKQYFVKSFRKLEFNTENRKYEFNFKIQLREETSKKYSSDIFSYLKKFIFHCPLFKLSDQENLKGKPYSIFFQQNNEKTEDTKLTSNNFDQSNEDGNIFCKLKFNQDKNQKGTKLDLIEKSFETPGELFDFITQKENIKSDKEQKFNTIFINEIRDIIRIMNDILFTKPYPILFGRISIATSTTEEDRREEINQLFYEGFGI